MAVVCGVDHLQGAQVRATDLRGGAAWWWRPWALGREPGGVYPPHQRGYEDIARDLRALGAEIREE